MSRENRRGVATPVAGRAALRSDEMPRLRDADWLATLLGVSRQRAYALAREDLVPCVRIGRKVVFDERAVFRWIEQGGSAEPGATGFARR